MLPLPAPSTACWQILQAGLLEEEARHSLPHLGSRPPDEQLQFRPAREVATTSFVCYKELGLRHQLSRTRSLEDRKFSQSSSSLAAPDHQRRS